MPVTVRITENFVANLQAMEAYYAQHAIDYALDRAVAAVFDSLVPNLERFPDMGRPFLERCARSAAGIKLRDELLGEYRRYTMREYLLERHAVLYAVRDETVYLLAIKDFRQLSYDFGRLWEG
jgi:ParE toxin of type II toxin-antitoxin system, parDE